MNPGLEIQTIGHSTRSAEVFLALLQAHGVGQVADIRTVPKSRRHPHFNGDALASFLGLHGIGYRHFAALGGLRKPKPDSVNTAWRHPGFRGYAGHMQSEEFRRGLENLLSFASESPSVIMCAEAVWWRCHRQLLSDALLARGVPVRHILTLEPPKPHHLSEFAKIDHGAVTYPGLV